MALNLPDLRARSPNIPQPDFSWLDALSSAGSDIIGHVSENKAFARLDDQFSRMSGATAATGLKGSFISQLMGDAGQSSVASAAPSAGRSAVPHQPPIPGIQMQPPKMAQDGSTFQPFIETVKAGGVSNPYALAAIAATGKAESGWSPGNANRTWSDPSQSGAAGTAGGVMSWRNERLQNLYAYAQQKGEAPGNISPQTQAEFFLREDPQLIQRLNQARSPEEAADIMAGAWKFAGYDQQGGEAARRRSLAASYAPQFAGDAGNSVDAVNAMGQGGQIPGYVDPMVSAPNSRPQAAVQRMSQPMPANQVADASGSVLAPAVTPLGRGEVPSDLIRFMLRDPQLREMGKQLWQQNAGKSAGSEWDFAKLDDGTLVRQNKQTGEVQRVGQFAKPQETPNSYQEFQLAQREGFQGTYADWQKVKTPGTSVTVNNGEGDKFYENLDKKNAETFSAMSESGMQARSKLAQIDRLEGLMSNAPQGAIGALKQAAGEWGIATEGLSDIQAATAMLEKMVPEQRPPGSGPMSDADIAMFRASLPRVLNQPGGNELIMQTMKGIAQYEIQMGEIADMVADREIKPAEGRKMIRELQNPLANFKTPTAPTPNAGTKKTKTGVQWKVK